MNKYSERRFAACLPSSLSLAVIGLLALAAPWLAIAGPAPEDRALAQRLQIEESMARVDRAVYADYFRQAYARYPAIPAGTLESVAYVMSRWQHLQPSAAQYGEQHQHMPRSYGVMGLYRGEGFADQVGEGARLLGVPAARVQRDPLSNILAAAALLDRELRADGIGAKAAPEATRPALERYAGFARGGNALARSAIQDHARSSFAFDVLLAQDKGVNDRGIVVPARAVAWERAFDARKLVQLRAPFVRLDVANDRVETPGLKSGGYAIDPLSETLTAPSLDSADTKSTDYGPALWVASPYHSTRNSYDSVTIHTMQGYYAGSISWFQNNPYSVSAHYLVRSSDGQITQMVREDRASHHVGIHNKTTLGIEHEGFINNASWYTSAMYNASAALTRHFCARYSAISCASAFRGPAGSGINVLPTSVKVKGHQHYSGQDHTDPGINWDWARYYNLLNPGSGTGTVIDSFESTVGHFDTGPAYSGSTTGIAATSLGERNCATRKNGECSLRVLLKDDTASASDWAVRLLSASGTPASNAALTRANGKVGFWVYTGATGMSAALGIDDSDGTERSVSRAIPAGTWTYLEWRLDDAAQWDAWVGNANGAITGSTVKLDAIWLYRDQTSYDVNLYLDDVQVKY
ncbi:N-acetylmuramoyl-L-alanine amidase A domain protein [Lysobacter antibioticus]|uniref:N-acetylmuramoyl-L-alanine amidase n=1 Tax=Lysobacter antibioticus TaxID=84531 RepID=UPI000717495F|nr:peptidoglycan recognition family protein [Lysobacter antibioticus]ALN63371.1 N-acetylmuramoyl-L-alanine amidase A domain protein [Lysobacter antibioticus]